MVARIGEPAPDFALRDQHGQEVSLSGLRGRAVVLMFYPWAFSRVCTGELCAVRDRLPRLADEQSQVLAISCDSVFTLRAFAEEDGLTFPLLSDFWPHGEVARAYDNFDDRRGNARRSTFIVDADGVLRWEVRNATPDARDLDETLRVLDEVAPV